MDADNPNVYNLFMPTSSSFTGRLSSITLLLIIFLPIAIAQNQNVLQPFVGQKLILLHLGDSTGAKIKKKDLAKVKGGCNIAVLVREASFDKGKVRLRLEDIGTPQINGVQNNCKEVHNEFSLEISGFVPNETAESVTASVQQLLQTPEQYLIANGIPFDLSAGSDGENAVKPSPGAVPKILLSVDPVFSEDARREKYQGTVVFKLIIGSDGRLHQPQVARSIGHGLDENAYRVLSMWRFDPLRKSGTPVACYGQIEINFRLY